MDNVIQACRQYLRRGRDMRKSTMLETDFEIRPEALP